MMTLMEFASSIISTCFTAMVMLAILSVILLIIFDHLNKQKRLWNSWRKFAENNGLAFRPNNFFSGAQVFGNFRGHYLNLESIQKGSSRNSQTYTRLSLYPTHRVYHSIPVTDPGISITSLNVDDAINLLTRHEVGHGTWDSVEADSKGQRISYIKPGIETNIKYLQSRICWLSDVADAYPAIVALGGEAVAPLHSLTKRNRRLRPLATQLLRDIADDTIPRLSNHAKNLICPRCLTCCRKHQIKLSWWQSITYYGCRTCHQSREFVEGWVVARLDNTMTQELVQQNGVLRVNWLSRRALFDFDEVEIIQATDEEVERFAVQVGNDTDRLRKPRYQQMRCVVSADCGLSENSHRILRRMFGSVELRDTEFIREVAGSHERTTNHRNRTIDPEAIYPGGRTGSAAVGR